ncbi:hypothetical protein [Psychrobacter urativorans]|uniref:hypothetical protein n=1 Tax=Psychrobacter urativorans TaxID=45610 RepID=UPI00191B2C8D|nr:hypothetical protein [Psychrobacter urativorans]
MSSNEIANQYNQWVGIEELPDNENHYFFETMNLVSRGEILLENGILNQCHNDLYMSALTEFILITRSLLEKYLKQNKDDEQVKKRRDHIKIFRDGLCHTNSLINTDTGILFAIISMPANYDGSMICDVKNGKVIMKDGTTFTHEKAMNQADDILHRQGAHKLWIKKELIADFCFSRDYFARKLPYNYATQIRHREFINSYKTEK